MNTKRLYGLDVLRGFAIALMIVFHFFYNLEYFSILHVGIRTEQTWILFRILIVTIFLFSVGIGIKLTHITTIKYKKVIKRVFILSLSSALVTVVTYIQFSDAYVYFGALHFILFASVIGLIFLNIPIISLMTAIVIFIGSATNDINMNWLFNILQPVLNLPIDTVDLMRFFPWFGVVLFGIVTVSLKLHVSIFNNIFFNPVYPHNRFLNFIGRYSLAIYLIHQPILFGLTQFYVKIATPIV